MDNDFIDLNEHDDWMETFHMMSFNNLLEGDTEREANGEIDKVLENWENNSELAPRINREAE